MLYDAQQLRSAAGPLAARPLQRVVGPLHCARCGVRLTTLAVERGTSYVGVQTYRFGTAGAAGGFGVGEL